MFHHVRARTEHSPLRLICPLTIANYMLTKTQLAEMHKGTVMLRARKKKKNVRPHLEVWTLVHLLRAKACFIVSYHQSFLVFLLLMWETACAGILGSIEYEYFNTYYVCTPLCIFHRVWISHLCILYSWKWLACMTLNINANTNDWWKYDDLDFFRQKEHRKRMHRTSDLTIL